VQKAYLAVAFAARPAVLIADEPMSGLDAAAARAAELLLRDLAAEGSVVVALAHAPLACGDRSYELRSGSLTEPAQAEAVRQVEIVLGPPDRVGAVVADGLPLGVRIFDGVLAAPRDQVSATLRWALDAGLDVVRVDPGEAGS
jgi:energy-coupling factor transporter ATP-binding protein EcfA2